MARPNIYPYWATDDITDPIYNTPNKSVPETDKQDYGQRGNQNTFRQDINYLFNSIRTWIQFFDGQYELGHVVFEYDNPRGTAPSKDQLSNNLGGTWEYIDAVDGQTTLAGQLVVGYRKISEVN